MRSFFEKYTFHIIVFIIVEISLFIYLLSNHLPFVNLSPDAQLYYNIAENFANGNGLINTIREDDIIVPPLFPLLISPFVFLFDSPSPFIFLQYIIFGINGVFLFAIAKKLFNNNFVGFISILLLIIQPLIFKFGPQHLLTETIFITFILLVALLSIHWVLNPTNKGLTILITVLSLSILFRPHLMYVFLLIGLIWLFFVKKKILSWKGILAFIIPVLLLFLNGTYNSYVNGQFAMLENYSGQNLYIANNPETEIDYYYSSRIEKFVEPFYFTLDNMTLSEKSAILKDRAMHYIIFEPFETIKRVLLKMVLFFESVSKVDYFSILLAAIGWVIAFIATKKEYKVLTGFFLLYILGFAALTSAGLIVGEQRYRAPIIPIYLLFTAYAIYRVIMIPKFFIRSKNK